MTSANAGSTRVPAGGRLPSGALVRITIQSAPGLLGSVNGPTNVAPASSVITSPGRAVFKAVWKSSPTFTAMIRPDEGAYVVSTEARGVSGVVGSAVGLVSALSEMTGAATRRRPRQLRRSARDIGLGPASATRCAGLWVLIAEEWD